jgi:hypothetical protein
MRFVRALDRFQLWCNLYGTREGGTACRDVTVDQYDTLAYLVSQGLKFHLQTVRVKNHDQIVTPTQGLIHAGRKLDPRRAVSMSIKLERMQAQLRG